MGACGSVNAAPTGKISTAAAAAPTTAPKTAQQTSQQSDVTGTQSITTTTTTTTTTMTTSNIVRLEPTHKKTLLKQDSSTVLTPRHHHEPSKELPPRDSLRDMDDADSTTSSDVENDKIVNEMIRENDERIASLNRILASSSSTPSSTTTTPTATVTATKARPRLSIHSDKEIKSNKPTSKTTPDTPRSNEKAKNKALEEAEEQLRLAREKVEMINLLKQMNETPSKWLQQLADQDASQASFEAKLTQLQKLKSEAAERVRVEREQRLQQAVTNMSNAKFDEFQAAIQRDKAAYDATVLKDHAGANARERAMQRQLTAEEAAAEAKRLEDETIAFRAQLAATEKEKEKEKENALVKSVKKQKAKAEVETRIRAAETAATQAEEAARKAKVAAETARALAEQAKTKALEHSPSLSTVGPQQPRTGSISMSYDFDHHIELDELEPVDERGGKTKSPPSAAALIAKKIPTLVSSRSSSHLNCDPEEEMRRLTAELHALFRVMNTTDEMGKPSLEGLSKSNMTMKRTSGTLTSPMKQRLQSEIAAKRAEIERLELQLLTAEQCEERVRVMDHDAQAMDAGTARDVALKKVALWSMHAQLKRKQEAALVKENEKATQEAHVFAMMQEALAAEKMRQQRAMG